MKKSEVQLQELSDAWRVLGRLNLVDTIFNHMSAAVPSADGQLQIVFTPYGLFPHEVSPEELKTVSLRPYLSSEGKSLGVNPDGLRLHSLLHCARMRPGVVVHTHSQYCIAVGCTKAGLLPLSQAAIEFVGELSTLEYSGLFRSQDLSKKTRKLAISGGAAFLRNHGILVIADTIPEAVYLAFYLEEACKIQVLALSQQTPVKIPVPGAINFAHDDLRQDRREVAEHLFAAFRRTLLRKNI